MKGKFCVYILVILLSHSFANTLLASSSQATLKSNDIMKKMHSVENGLKLRMHAKGQPVQEMNILDRMKYHKVPAVSIAIINHGKVEWAKAYHTNAENITTQTLFQAGSISKPIAAVVALFFVEKNKLHLDQNVNDILKTWKVPNDQYTKKEKVTLRRLLSHTAGLTVHGFDGYSSSFDKKDLPTIIQILNGEKPAKSARVVVNNIPGTAFSYSGGGYIIVQKMLDDVTQEKFSDLAQDVVFKPLKMKSSTYELIWPSTATEEIAVGHSEDGKVIPGNWHMYPESAAAGLWTTPSNLAYFLIDIQNTFSGRSNNVLSMKMTKEMLTRQTNSQMGLGFAVNKINSRDIEFSHSGSNDGYIAYFVGFTETGKGAVIMTNSDNGYLIFPEIIRSIADAYLWPKGYTYQSKTMKTTTVDPVIYQNYAGQFEAKADDLSIKVMLSTKDNKFYMALPWPNPTSKNKTFELIPESNIKFVTSATSDADLEIIFTPGNNNEFTIMGMKAKRVGGKQ